MSYHPDAATRRAVVSAIHADAAIVALIGKRVYDSISSRAEYPFVRFVDVQVVEMGAGTNPDGTNEHDASEVFVQLAAETDDNRAVGLAVIVGHLRRILARKLTMPTGFACKVGEFVDSRTFLDNDGLRGQSAVTFRYVIEPVDVA